MIPVMTTIILFILVILQNMHFADAQCSLDRNCKCTALPMGYAANCSGLGLTSVPRFYPDVVDIDLSYNKITKIPNGNLSVNVLHLDLSFNNISKIHNGSFQRLSKLRKLVLYGNNLELTDQTYYPGIFHGLNNLTHLNIKKNRVNIFKIPKFYPIEFAKLKSLETLLIDDMDSHFGSEYRKLKNLKQLDISGIDGHCKLHFVSPDYFSNLGNLEILNISGCRILRIEKGTFMDLVHLQELDISDNYDLTFRVFSNITYGLQFTDIRILKANRIHYVFGIGTEVIREDVTFFSNVSQLQKLYLEGNRLEIAQIGVLKNFPKSLQYMSVADNRLTFGFYDLELSNLNELKELDVSFQNQGHNVGNLYKQLLKDYRSCDNAVPRPCTVNDNPSEIILQLFTKDNKNMFLNGGWHEFPFPVPENLEKLHLRQGSFSPNIPKVTFQHNRVKYLDLSWNILNNWEGPIINTEALEHVDLSHNYCFYVSKVFFKGQTQIKKLVLNNNLLGYNLSKDIEGEIFSDLMNLKHLDISSNYIQSLGSDVFRGLKNVAVLKISNNDIRDWQFEIRHMFQLEYIDFSINQLNTIPEIVRTSLDDIDKEQNVTLDFTGNNFDYSCENLEFLKWIRETKITLKNFNNYSFKYANGTISNYREFNASFPEFELNCVSKTALIAGISSAILVSIVIVVGGLIYRFRWKLRYLYYMTINKYRGYAPVTDHTSPFEFDAFISYADSDRSFVVRDMVQNLEQDAGCRLCIHHRDFIPGADIAANITNAIHKSNKTVILLSASFLRSYWCMFEFNMARMESIYSRDGRNVLFLIFYENISASSLPMMMLELIESQSYIEYPNDSQGNIVFWEKVKEAIMA